MKKYTFLAMALAGAMLLAGCGNQGNADKQQDNPLITPEVNQEELSPRVNDWTRPIGVYANALDFLYHQDEGLNDGIEMVAFDFSGCTNLSQEDKTALMEYLADKWGVPYMKSNLAQLKEEGYIKVDENGFTSFEKGILVSIDASGNLQEAADGEDFVFTVEKYRTSLGAYWLADCKATFDGTEWAYHIGSHAIS